ncbi:hypothetical protein V8E36_006373 [Tilletia maclaganii]
MSTSDPHRSSSRSPSPTDPSFSLDVEDAFLTSLGRYTSGVFSQDDVGASLTSWEGPPSSQVRLFSAVSKLDSIRAGTVTVDAFFDGLPPFSQEHQPRYAQVRSGLAALPLPSQQPEDAPSSLLPASASAGPSTGVQLLIEAASSRSELPPPTLRSRSSSGSSSSSQSSISPGPQIHQAPPTTTAIQSALPLPAPVTGQASSSTADRLRWPLRDELKDTAALHYRGPLSAAEVKAALQLDLSDNARRALTGSHIGYLQYFHFLGHADQQTAMRRGPKRQAVSDLTAEKWQCRLCHTCLHVAPRHPSNLGAHLFGGSRRFGCLDDRRSDPIEDVPPPERHANGDLVRLNAATRRHKAIRKQPSPTPGTKMQPPARAHPVPVPLKEGLPFELSQVATAVAQAASHRASSSTLTTSPSRSSGVIQPPGGGPRIQPFFFVATDSRLNILSVTWPASFLIGWEDVQLCTFNLVDIIDPEDRYALENLLRPRPGDAADLRALLGGDDASDAVPSSAQAPRIAPPLPFGWYATSAFPAQHHEAQVLFRHFFGFNDHYRVRLHFCPRPNQGSSLDSMFLVWTFLKIGNRRDFPSLILAPGQL